MRFQRRELLRTLSFAFGSSFIWNGNELDIAAQTAIQPKVSPLPAGAAVRDGISGGTEMEKVSGIGGFFFRAKDPKALALWYQEHLGILTTPTKEGETSWHQEGDFDDTNEGGRNLVASRGRINRFHSLQGEERLFRRSPEGLDAELSSARSRQNGGPATSCGNRRES